MEFWLSVAAIAAATGVFRVWLVFQARWYFVHHIKHLCFEYLGLTREEEKRVGLVAKSHLYLVVVTAADFFLAVPYLMFMGKDFFMPPKEEDVNNMAAAIFIDSILQHGEFSGRLVSMSDMDI